MSLDERLRRNGLRESGVTVIAAPMMDPETEIAAPTARLGLVVLAPMVHHRPDEKARQTDGQMIEVLAIGVPVIEVLVIEVLVIGVLVIEVLVIGVLVIGVLVIGVLVIGVLVIERGRKWGEARRRLNGALPRWSVRSRRYVENSVECDA